MRYVFFFICCFLNGCDNGEFVNQVEFISECERLIESNLVEKKSNGYILTLKQKPKEYLAVKELNAMEHQSEFAYDSLLESYGNGIYFTLTIGPDKEKRTGDLINQGLKDYDEYKRRIHTLSFKLDNMLSLKLGDREIKPVLTDMERTFAVMPERNFNISFLPSDKEISLIENNLEVIFHDKIFETGISHFHFSKIGSKSLPQLKIVAS